MGPVSIVIPCYNPSHYLLKAIASARAQKECAVEVVLVDDGTDSQEGRALLESARGLADRYLEDTEPRAGGGPQCRLPGSQSRMDHPAR